MKGAGKIVVATDGSSDAVQAVEGLAQFPLPADASVHIVSCIPWPESITRAGPALTSAAHAVVDDARARLAKRWARITGAVEDGDPRSVIVETAESVRADLVVVGARSLGLVASALLGSVSLGVARHAPCAVLVCKGPVRPLRSVTVALDGSEAARRALEFFAALPLPRDLAVRLVGVIEPLRYPAVDIVTPELMELMKEYEDERRAELEQVLADAAATLRGQVRRVSTTTLVGQAAPSILSEAAKQPSDLVVVGARGLGTVSRLLLGSVSESVLRHASCSVLIVRPAARA
jgi:nucleotide-binding universal stress UspA family protein